jgi:UDP-N-acetyl-D-glucosamine dehydrogenase
MTLIENSARTDSESLIVPVSSAVKELHTRLVTREAIIAVVGLGYVGLPLAIAYAEAGFRVLGIDIDPNRVKVLRKGHSPVEDIHDDQLRDLVAPLATLFRAPASSSSDTEPAGCLIPTCDYDQLGLADAIIVCVPTPLTRMKDPDISSITAATEEISSRLRPGVLVILESTTYPGTTEEVMLPLLEHPSTFRRTHDATSNGGHGSDTPRSPLVVGRDFFLAFSPERIDPGRTDFNVRTTPKVVGGVTPACLHVATTLYGTIVDKVVPVSEPKVAELVKLLENTFRSVNIGLANEFAKWCECLDVDVWEVIDAAASKPYGFMPFRPGPGLGGHCIPIDPLYLAWKLRQFDRPAEFIQLAAEVNASMPHYILEKIASALNTEAKSIKNARVLVLGVAYKPNISDVRESPALDLIRLLQKSGARVSFSDPHVHELRIDGSMMHSVSLDDAVLRAADCVVIETDHGCFDWSQIARCSRLVVDTRNALANVPEVHARVVKL